jgi:hypothetical protein
MPGATAISLSTIGSDFIGGYFFIVFAFMPSM